MSSIDEMKCTESPERMLVALDLLKQYCGKKQHEEEEDEGHEIWPEQSIRLESTLWQNFPSDLLFNSLLVHLSFPCLLRLRRVSRLWRSGLSSSAFWRSWFCHNPNTQPSPELALQSISKSSLSIRTVTTRDNQLVSTYSLNHNPNMRRNVYVPYLLLCSASPPASLHGHAARWVKQKSVKYVRSRGSVPADVGWFRLQESFIQMQEPYTILASEKGLLLLALHSRDPKQLLVCNPLLREQRFLPNPISPLVMGISAARFFVDGGSGDYIVILRDSQVYHSKLGKWQVTPHHAGEKSALPPLLDGSNFWLSQQQLSGSNDLALFAYHPREELVTSVQTQFPLDVSLPKGGFVWKDSQALQTLAGDSTCFGVWKFDDGFWKELKRLQGPIRAVSKLSYVKIGNLLLMNELGLNQFKVFDLELERCTWVTNCPLSHCLTAHCAFQPSYFEV